MEEAVIITKNIILICIMFSLGSCLSNDKKDPIFEEKGGENLETLEATFESLNKNLFMLF